MSWNKITGFLNIVNVCNFKVAQKVTLEEDIVSDAPPAYISVLRGEIVLFLIALISIQFPLGQTKSVNDKLK